MDKATERASVQYAIAYFFFLIFFFQIIFIGVTVVKILYRFQVYISMIHDLYVGSGAIVYFLLFSFGMGILLAPGSGVPHFTVSLFHLLYGINSSLRLLEVDQQSPSCRECDIP